MTPSSRGERSDGELVEYATTGAKDPSVTAPGELDEIVGGLDYQDWRAEIMGLFQVEV